MAAPPELLRAVLRGRLPEFEELATFGRSTIGAGAARLACARATPPAGRRSPPRPMSCGSKEVAAFRRADSQFHLLVACIAGNRLLERAIQDARERMFGVTDALPFALRVKPTADEYARGVNAMRRGRLEAAAASMVGHLGSALEWLRAEVT